MEFLTVMYVALLYYSTKKAVDSRIILNEIKKNGTCTNYFNETLTNETLTNETFINDTIKKDIYEFKIEDLYAL